MHRRLMRTTIALLPLQALTACRGVEASQCSADEVTATVRQLGGEGSDDPRLAELKKSGVEFVVTLDAIRTVSSSPKLTVCEGRLTKKFTVVPHEASDPQPETSGEKARRAQMEHAMGLGGTVSEIAYKVEKTDDGSDYVTIIPSAAAIEQQGRQGQEDEDRQRQMQEQQSQDAERERAYQQQRDDLQQQEWRARQEQLEQEEMQRQRTGQ